MMVRPRLTTLRTSVPPLRREGKTGREALLMVSKLLPVMWRKEL